MNQPVPGVAEVIYCKECNGTGVLAVVPLNASSPQGDGVHTDHPMRHYDRTCPACNAGVETDSMGGCVSQEPQTLSFAERCRIAQECLPDAEYRARLKALHDEMLAAIDGVALPAPPGWKLVPAEPTQEWIEAMEPIEAYRGVAAYSIRVMLKKAPAYGVRVDGEAQPSACPDCGGSLRTWKCLCTPIWPGYATSDGVMASSEG